jgi:hypothetical protein
MGTAGQELRQKAVAAFRTGRYTQKEPADVYGVHEKTIEKMWSKVKQILRGLKPRTPDELFSSVGKVLGMVSADDAQGWFGSCGYI